MNHRHDAVARQRILPCAELGVSDLGLHEIHLADVALILLERGQLLGVGRPGKNRAIGVHPAGVVGGVAEVFHAIGGDLRLLIGHDIAHPEVPVADERGGFAVGRHVLGGATTRACGRPASGAGGFSRAVGASGRAVGLGALGRVDHHQRRAAVGQSHTIGEAAVGEPGRLHTGARHQIRRVEGEEALGPRIVGGRDGARLGEQGGGQKRARKDGTKERAAHRQDGWRVRTTERCFGEPRQGKPAAGSPATRRPLRSRPPCAAPPPRT